MTKKELESMKKDELKKSFEESRRQIERRYEQR
jgi:hypothetical protein